MISSGMPLSELRELVKNDGEIQESVEEPLPEPTES